MTESLSILNILIYGIYLSGMLVIGLYFAGKQNTTEDYFLAGRSMPWLPVAMSMYASLTSAVTYMGLPGIAYRSNVTLLVVCIVSPLLAPCLIFLFYPFYRRLRVTTSYEYIDRRFGSTARRVVAGLFLLARLGWLGTVIFAPALALSTVTGIPLAASILVMGVLATVYTVLGGMSAVLWTDVVQFVILIGGAVWVACLLVMRVPGGFMGIIRIASQADHIQLNTSVSLYEMTAIVVGVSFFLQMMQDYGTDQVTVQRLLAVRSYKGMIKAVLFNAGTDCFIIATLMFIGLGLFSFYQVNPAALAGDISGDQIFPHFIITQLPNGVSGLLVAAIFAAAMSSMDSGINSMSTVLVNDFIRPLRKKAHEDHSDVTLARILTLVLGVFSTAMAFYVSSLEGIIEAFATFMSLFNAPVLALFLLGILWRKSSFAGWGIGAVLSVAGTYWLQNHTEVSWVYYFPFSFIISLVGGALGSVVLPGREGASDLVIWTRAAMNQTD
ncbi:MAG: sodium/solute symporter [Verrucomicrobia bacterium]|nr:sodium/solute symporter [Verrucomicrobiota bacterium]